MMTCQELTELVTDYLEGRMSFMERLSFRLHLAMCKACKAYVRQMEQTVEVLGGLPDDYEVPEDVRAGLLDAFRDWEREGGCDGAGGPMVADLDDDGT